MDTAALTEFISDLLEKIYYLADASQKKCQALSDIDNSVIRCKHILKLCSRIQKNCMYFEKDLIQEAFKYNIVLRNEENDSSGCMSDTSHDGIKNVEVDKNVDSNKHADGNENNDNGLTISLKFGNIVENEKFLQPNGIDISKFWLDLKKFTANYLCSQGNNKNNDDIRQSTSTQTEHVLKEVLDCEDPVLRQIKEIFGSDLELDQSITEKSRNEISKSQNNSNCENDVPIQKVSGDSAGNDESKSSPMEISDKEEEDGEKANKELSKENTTDNSHQQMIPQQSTNKDPNEKVENKEIAEKENKNEEIAEKENKNQEEGPLSSLDITGCEDLETAEISSSRDTSEAKSDVTVSLPEKEVSKCNEVLPSKNAAECEDLETAEISTSRDTAEAKLSEAKSASEDPSPSLESSHTSISIAEKSPASDNPSTSAISSLQNTSESPASPEASTSTNIDTNSASQNLEATQTSTRNIGEDTPEDLETSQRTTSREIEEEIEEDLLPTQIVSPRNIANQNTESDLEATQTATSKDTVEKDQKNQGASEAAASENLEMEDEELEATQIAPSRNIEEDEASEDLEATQTTISRNIEDESAASKDVEDTRIITSETQSTTYDLPSQDLTNVVKDSDSPRKKEFLSVLGLAKADTYEQSKEIRDSLMDVLVEVAYREGGDSGAAEREHTDEKDVVSDQAPEEYSDEEVADALKYFQQSDSSSECGSVKSVRTDSLFLSDNEEDTNLTSDSNISKSIQSTSEKKIEDVSSKIEPISEKSPSKEVSKLDDVKETFSPKNCVVEVERLKIDNLQNGATNSDTASTKNEDLDEKKFIIKDCFVKLEYLRLLQVSSDSDDERSSSSNEDGEIDNLCDLSNLSRKRKEREASVDSQKKKKRNVTRIKRKRKKINVSGSDTSDLTGFSSVSDDEIGERRGGIFDDEFGSQGGISTALDPNELLTEIVCHTIHDTGSSSSFSESNEEVKLPKKSKRDSSSTKNKGEDSKSGTWRDDPLLTGKLSLPSDEFKTKNSKKHKRRRKSSSSSNDSDRAGQIKKKKKTHKQLDPNWQSDESSSPSSSGEEFDVTPFIKSLTRPINSILSNDSDIEFVDGTPSKTSVISLDSDEEHDKKHGRRNILSVLSSGELKQETQKAAKEEEERIIKLQMRNQMRISQSQVRTEDSLILDTSSEGYNLTVDPVLSKKLLPHQEDGVKFMWDACYLSVDSLETFEGTGCILAHNMGLGKTFQVVTLVHTLFSHSITNTKHVLIVCPLSTVSGWKKEFNWGVKMAANKMSINIISIESSDDSDSKCGKINKWKNKGGVLIVGYEAFEKLTSLKKSSAIKAEFLRKALVTPGPDLVVCDEGHLLKNGNTLRTKALMEIRTKRRIALTGTPLQNNLTEYYFMVQFVKPNLLGTKHEFVRQFVNPIMNGQYEDSVEADFTLMKKRTHVLHRLLKNTVQRYESTELQKYIENLKDYALFVQLHPVQEELYRYYIQMTRARKNTKDVKAFKNFFNDYQLSKFICSHPQLLYTMETQNAQGKKKVIKEKDTISEEPEVQEVDGIPEGWWKSKCPEEVKTSIEFGTKLHVMMGIIEEAEKIGDKVLIFTSSLVELSSIEYFLKLKGTPSCPSWRPRNDYFRMDGTVSPSVRTQMCEMFNNKNNKKLRVFLMSHKVGGLGLNLVAANRVILLGANFNPSHDSQSIFRAYRFGQQKSVYIYRLLSMGTMEEKIYHRCVTKLAIASRVVDKHQIARHYKNLDLEDLYTVAVDLSLERSIPSKPEDNLLSNILLKFDCIHKYHQHQKLLENRPDEDLNEEDKMKAWEEFKMINDPNKNPADNPSNPPRTVPQNKPSPLADIVQMRWNQLNPLAPSSVDGAVDPLAIPTRSNPLNPFVLSNVDGAVHSLAIQSRRNQLNPLVLSSVDGAVRPPAIQTRRNQLNPLVPSNVDGAVDPLAIIEPSQLYATGGHFMSNMVPNPAILNKGLEKHNVGDRVNVQYSNNDILQNVSNNPKKNETKKKTTTMGPNPFVIHTANNKKENVSKKGGGGGITPWRKTSSDDFQKPTSSRVSKTNLPSHKDRDAQIAQRKLSKAWSAKEGTSSLSKVLQKLGSSRNSAKKSNLPSTSTSIAEDDDDDVILIDSPEKKSPAEGRGKRAKAVNDAIERLNKNISVTFGSKKSAKKDAQGDAFVIEIL